MKNDFFTLLLTNYLFEKMRILLKNGAYMPNFTNFFAKICENFLKTVEKFPEICDYINKIDFIQQF